MGQMMLPAQDQQTMLQQLLATKSVVESICNWNAARYTQEPSHQLTLDLLLEEVNELAGAYQAEEPIDILDGLGDTFYVTIGALWKTGLGHQQIGMLLDTVEARQPWIPTPEVCLHWYQVDVQNHILAMLALSCVNQLEHLLDTDQRALDVIRAICISNDTKAVKKTATGVKANIDKGATYVPPTAHLEAIFKEYTDVN